jgi:diguanylate cyclase (GGDEF)-like protein
MFLMPSLNILKKRVQHNENLLEFPSGILIIKEHGKTLVEKLDRRILTIGRSSKDDIVLQSKGISRCHASVYIAKGKLWILDGDLKGKVSTNGLFVNGRRISVRQLKPYDIISFSKGIHALFMTQKCVAEATDGVEEFTRCLAHFIVGKDHNGHSLTNLDSPQEPTQHTFINVKRVPFLDSLTKLPNRDSFFARVKKIIEFRQKITPSHDFAVLFIDVDRFKMINDSLGHLTGDKFLVQLAQRLQHGIREGDMVARLGGDEFAILLDGLHSPDEAIDIAKRLQQSISSPLVIDEHELYPSVSIGIALSSLGYKTVEEIIRDADTAMYHAKKIGRARFVVFDVEMHQKALQLLRLDGDLRRAIEKNQLQLYYQPIVSLTEHTLVGFEALLRWHHPDNGVLSPETFIPIAEENNLIHQIGQWVIKQACLQLMAWQSNPNIDTALTMNINISSKQLTEKSLVEQLVETVKTYGVSSNAVKLEVTESILMENTQHSLEILTQLKQAGFQLSIDDFGKGYSSLSYLHKFPIDTLKVDRSFISKIDQSDSNTCIDITHSIIALAHSLGVKVVAEGIERLYHLAWLQQQRCDYGQGFLFSQPMTAKDATRFAEQGLTWSWS